MGYNSGEAKDKHFEYSVKITDLLSGPNGDNRWFYLAEAGFNRNLDNPHDCSKKEKLPQRPFY